MVVKMDAQNSTQTPEIYELVRKVMECYGANNYRIIIYNPNPCCGEKLTLVSSGDVDKDTEEYIGKMLNEIWNTYSKALPESQLIDMVDILINTIATKFSFHFLKLYDGYHVAWVIYKK